MMITLNGIIDESVQHIIGDRRKFYYSKELVEILANHKELRVKGLVADFLSLTIGACFWYKEIKSKKYTRLKNKLSKENSNFRQQKTYQRKKDINISRYRLSYDWLNKKIRKLALDETSEKEDRYKKKISLIKKEDHIIKIYYYELYQLVQKYNIKNPKYLVDDIVYDLFKYEKNINIYKRYKTYHLYKKIYYFST